MYSLALVLNNKLIIHERAIHLMLALARPLVFLPVV